MALGSGPTIPFDQVKVTLKRGNIVLEKTAPTEEGKFAFTRLTEGEYEVIIEAPGYHPFYRRSNLRYPGNDVDNFSARLVPVGNDDDAALIPPEALKLFEKGLGASRAGNHERAAARYQEALDIAPDYAEAWNNLGNEYRLLNRQQKAEIALWRALALDPESALARLNLGMLYLGRGQAEAARRNLEAAVEADPKLAQGHLLLGLIAYQNRELDAAAASFQRALELDPEAASEATLYLGSVRAAQGQLGEGGRLLEEFLRDHPRHPKAPTAKALLRKIRDSAQNNNRP